MTFVEKRQAQIQRHHLAGEVKAHLTTFERDLGRALASGSKLLGFLPEAREQASVSETVGQQAIGRLVASIAFVSQAMEQAAGGHVELDGIRRDLRIPETAGGDKIPLRVFGELAAQDGATAAVG
ncbi:hypothetical protein F9288_08890 [Sphingomonas sp. CL5.1]|uniref:hypothetical protein n=1 Tax=Sphingomonas sp. CL5.1 TaxID=2653203 RepID=UPI00158271E6|nr:hypothetical protein [Sphingomonas sp. CL5.1]QKR99742.1 hypothetical protein F9288_08890 [Sphingomonas sp. CL5.1]